MRVPELKALTRDRRLRNYSRTRKAELVALLQNNGPSPLRSEGPARSTGPVGSRSPTQTWDPTNPLRAPTQQEMDIFE